MIPLGATPPGQSEIWSGGKGYSALSKISALLKPQDQIVLCNILDIRLGSLIPLQRCSQCILQPLPTGQSLYLTEPQSTGAVEYTDCISAEG